MFFKDKDLLDAVYNSRESIRRFGIIRTKLIIRRLQTLKSVNQLEQLKGLPGRFHELKGNRLGQWACDLDQPYRLIFEPENKVGEPPCVIILEIVNYH